MPRRPTARAKYIAETFFDPGFRLVNEERGMLGFTGTFEGAPISVQSTGMGCPSCRIVFEELIMLGATRLMRVGTCGALQDHMRMGDTVVGISATADDATPLRYTQVDGFAADRNVHARRDGRPPEPRAGCDGARRADRDERGLLRPRPDHVPRGGSGSAISAIEMEAAMLYTIAAVKGVEALAMMTVSDIIGDPGEESERISDEELRRGVDAMMRLACRVVVS